MSKAASTVRPWPALVRNRSGMNRIVSEDMLLNWCNTAVEQLLVAVVGDLHPPDQSRQFDALRAEATAPRHHLLIPPGLADPLHRTDDGHLPQALGGPLDHLEHVRAECRHELAGQIGLMPRIIPEPGTFSMPSAVVNAEASRKEALNGWLCSRLFTHTPLTVTPQEFPEAMCRSSRLLCSPAAQAWSGSERASG